MKFFGLLCGLLLSVASAQAQNVPVVMLSDIHFDPFQAPSKVAQLRAAPAAQWAKILRAPDAAADAADFAALQKTCKMRGVDTPFALLESSLAAAKAVQEKPAFVTVSGDLMAHRFDCRFGQLAPKATAQEYSEFAAKTVEFVAIEVRAAFAGSPVYFALGNNDSGCEDYREDADSAFLGADARSFAAGVLDAKNAKALLAEFGHEGDYGVMIPAPFHKTRLLVLQDIFESKKYATCGGAKSASGESAQIAWLRAQLTAARTRHESVWVMAHIPPGVDAYSTITGGKDVCGGKAPEMFLDSPALAEAIEAFPDVIKLVLLGHTHNDEMRVYGAGAGRTIAGKLVPSISPVNGNNPAFTVAEVDAATATMKDYEVYSASNQTGMGTKWSEEYRYSTTYGMPDFSAASAAKLLAEFHADKSGASAASMAYEHFYFVGEPGIATGMSANAKAAAMRIVWPSYTCSMSEATEAGFRRCVCPAAAAKP